MDVASLLYWTVKWELWGRRGELPKGMKNIRFRNLEIAHQPKPGGLHHITYRLGARFLL